MADTHSRRTISAVAALDTEALAGLYGYLGKFACYLLGGDHDPVPIRGHVDDAFRTALGTQNGTIDSWNPQEISLRGFCVALVEERVSNGGRQTTAPRLDNAALGSPKITVEAFDAEVACLAETFRFDDVQTLTADLGNSLSSVPPWPWIGLFNRHLRECTREIEDLEALAERSSLQDRLTFDTFVQGPSNEFALAVARSVASWADGPFNPVLIYASCGFGKTHILNAIAWEAMRIAPDRRVVYCTAERLVSGFEKATKTAAFTRELRNADLLLIDDVQFLDGKEKSSVALSHTLAALMEGGRRVVFTADRPAAALSEIDARLRSHLSAGLTCGIEPADRALRLQVLERKAAVLGSQHGIMAQPPPEVLQFLADRCVDSIRELEGALNTLMLRAGAGASEIALEQEQPKAALGPDPRAPPRRHVTVDDIQKATAGYFGFEQADLIGGGSRRELTRARQVAMWLTGQLTHCSLSDIGRRFGGRHHATVLYTVRRIETLLKTDGQLERDLESLQRKLSVG